MEATDWLNPNYNLVEIVEFEMQIEKRRRIEDFIIQFFKDWETVASSKSLLVYTCQQLIKERRLCAITQDMCRHVTMGNFNDSFQAMCTLVFDNGNVKDEYIVSLLAFSIKLDECMHDYIWYTPKLLITSLIDALERVHFDPGAFDWDQSEGDLLQRIITSSFSILIPSLLFFYILLR